MTPPQQVSRRAVVQTLAATGLMTGLVTVGAGPAAAAGTSAVSKIQARARGMHGRIRPGRLSPNGWQIEYGADRGGAVWTRPVPGTPLRLALSVAAAQVILHHVVQRYCYEIDMLREGDVLGFGPQAPGRARFEANHASGTAIDIRPDWYPPGTRGGLFAPQVAVVRDIVAESGGVIAWGGDFREPAEAHFQIDVHPEDPRLLRFADQLEDWAQRPGQGAGVLRLGG